ncbi:DMT family transporter [Duganella sp. sic0402]|uniref:DMT family transporter n=1 Tax=Duganella sp. sic0402 TaxID=2854786 RepID=UPI001C457FEF|nr:DMT family transporter [Duganella sp. sic0402]MBV7535851.1 DMT family transporter [Duganella sp. sic0402]
MKQADLASLLTLAALWGASYLFMRVGAGEFGALTMAGARAAGAALLLLPLLARRDGRLAALRENWRRIALVGMSNCTLPFLLFGYAALSINASLSAIFNAATPLYAAIIGWLWIGERIDAARAASLALGFVGVTWLVWDGAGYKNGATAWAVLACVAATMLYAFSAHYSKQRLAHVDPFAVAAGSQLSSAMVLAVPALVWRPATMPSTQAWLALLALTVASTALAYVLFFRLIARIGAAKTMAVPFLVPAFGVLWGVLFLDEVFSAKMARGAALIVAGTALTTGVFKRGDDERKTPASSCLHSGRNGH